MIGASEIHRIMTASTKTLVNLRKEFRDMRAGQRERQFSTRSTEWGKRHEPRARANAEIHLRMDFEETGVVVHEELFYVGASPDGLNVEHQVGLELKCPHKPENHLAMLDKIPKPYLWQCQAGMWCTGFDLWIFGSFDPRRQDNDEPDYLIIHEIPRSDRMIAQLEERIPWFWSTLL